MASDRRACRVDLAIRELLGLGGRRASLSARRQPPPRIR
jgi:hypothetical protein